MPPAKPTVLFAGGGTGGHIFPNLAVLERMRTLAPDVTPHFLVSQRPVDARIMARHDLAHTALPAVSLATRPDRFVTFALRYRRSEAIVRKLIREHHAVAVVATGGFVSGPAVTAAARAGIPAALVNLDAVPGKSNQWAARKATDLFTVYPQAAWPTARTIGFPLREALVTPTDSADARRQLGLDPGKPTLLVTAGSQGARSINRAMIELVARQAVRAALASWNVLHLSGADEEPAVREAYAEAGITARVEAFSHRMDLAWSSAELAVSRAGAGSVAEVLASATPAIFLPYPFHKDQHQKLNAAPLVDAGGAVLFDDLVDAPANADRLAGPLAALLGDSDRRAAMRAGLTAIAPADGARTLAQWVADTAVKAPA